VFSGAIDRTGTPHGATDTVVTEVRATIQFGGGSDTVVVGAIRMSGTVEYIVYWSGTDDREGDAYEQVMNTYHDSVLFKRSECGNRRRKVRGDLDDHAIVVRDEAGDRVTKVEGAVPTPLEFESIVIRLDDEFGPCTGDDADQDAANRAIRVYDGRVDLVAEFGRTTHSPTDCRVRSRIMRDTHRY
jgi:hypothetical protein